MSAQPPFFARSVKVAESFLQTALVVDDRAFAGRRNDEVVFRATAPVTLETVDLAPPPETVYFGAEVSPEIDYHGLDAQAVIDGFAQSGIVCSVLHRRADDTLAEKGGRLEKLLQAADILVVDWHVHHGNEESSAETLELISVIIDQNQSSPTQQLRLVAIYTGELSLAKVADELTSRFKGKPVEKDGDFAFSLGNIRIVILGKKTGKRIATEQVQETGFDELGRRTIEEFARMTSGLVANVALESLDRLRKSTHQILSKFAPHLDAAFLVHRSLNESPGEADEHLLPLIAAELQAVMEGERSSLIDDGIEDWMRERQASRSTWQANSFASEDEEFKTLVSLVREGHSSASRSGFCECFPDFTEENLLCGIPNATSPPEEQVSKLDSLIELIHGARLENANEELAILMSVKTRYENHLPILSLGSILMSEEVGSKTFWLCLQPLCDCVRLSSTQWFPMLRLTQPGEKKPFSAVVNVDGIMTRLKIRATPSQLRTIPFKPDRDKKSVVAAIKDGKYFFTSQGPSSVSYRWISDLKFEHAQRAVDQFASQNSRVGLTESEWLRRWSK